MKKEQPYLILLILCSLIILSHCSDREKAFLRFHDSKGNVIDFNALHGKWVIINYWATWCHSCLSEIPELNHVYQKYHKQIFVMGVHYNPIKITALKQAKQIFKITYPILTEDPRFQLNLKDPGVVPVSYIINPKGKVIKILLGPQTEKSLLHIIPVH